jgi:hypothetical protein
MDIVMPELNGPEAANVGDLCVNDEAVYLWKAAHEFNKLVSTVGRDDVKFGSFKNQCVQKELVLAPVPLQGVWVEALFRAAART